MRNVLLALIGIPLVGACTATVSPGPSRPAPVREYREPREPPPPPPPQREHRDRDHDHDRNEPRVIEGTIRDAVTHRPIDRASVDVTGRGIQGEMTVQTGPDGRFRTGEIPRGEFAIRVRREGYEPFNRAATMNDGTARLDFELIPKRR
jgi:hypothetical protein